MKAFEEWEIQNLLTDEEREAVGMIMFDNCTVEQKQIVISLLLETRQNLQKLEDEIYSRDMFD